MQAWNNLVQDVNSAAKESTSNFGDTGGCAYLARHPLPNSRGTRFVYRTPACSKWSLYPRPGFSRIPIPNWLRHVFGQQSNIQGPSPLFRRDNMYPPQQNTSHPGCFATGYLPRGHQRTPRSNGTAALAVLTFLPGTRASPGVGYNRRLRSEIA